MEKEKTSFTFILFISWRCISHSHLTSQAGKCNQWQKVKIKEQVYTEAMEKAYDFAFCKWEVRKQWEIAQND